jgi:hypothetical protein
MSDRVESLLAFHQHKGGFGTKANLIASENEARRLYKSLSTEEIVSLVETAFASADEKYRLLKDVLPCLACFKPGSLDPFHERLAERHVFYPGVNYHGAAPEVAGRLLEMIDGKDGTVTLNHILLALAWIGDDVVQSAFAGWRRRRPGWADKLHVEPHTYSESAGWVLTENDSRRDLFRRFAIPLVPADDPLAIDGPVKVGFDDDEPCAWCNRPLTSLLDIDLTNAIVRDLEFTGSRLRFLTCVDCTCFGTIFTNVDFNGAAKWSDSNKRPDNLPEDPLDPIFRSQFPQNRLLLSSKSRHFLESSNWFLPGGPISQIGGLPAWIQEADYPECPSCFQKMPFVGQISMGELESLGEGIFYAFCCKGCGVAASNYQQS